MKNYKNLLSYITEYRKFQTDKLNTKTRVLEPELKLRIEQTIEAIDETTEWLKEKIKKQNQL